MDKFLILDIDGVLNGVVWKSTFTLLSYPLDSFDPSCVKRINTIVNETNCKVIISSDWRYTEGLQNIFNAVGLNFEIYGITPCADSRVKEIQTWLDNYTEPYIYCCLDDVHLFPLIQVQTDYSKGITDEDMDQVIKILNKI